MALPAGVAQLGTFKGEKGDTGSLAFATAESVPAGDVAAVEMIGPESNRGAHFKIPRGLPGVNAVANDAAMAALVGAVDSDTRLALGALFPVYRVWDGSAYPDRVPGTSNIFIGPVDPGLLMDLDDDTWANPDAATMADVVAAMGATGSALYAATQSVIDSRDVNLALTPASGSVVLATVGTQPAIAVVQSIPKGGTNSVRLTGRIPRGWNTAALRYRWMSLAGSGDARLNTYYSLARTGVMSAFSFTTTTQYTAAAVNTPVQVTFGSAIPVTPGDMFNGSITRVSDSSNDTLTGAIGILDAWLERLS